MRSIKKIDYGFGEAVNLYYQSIYFSEARGDLKKAMYYNDQAYQGARTIKNDSLALYINFRKSTLFGSLGIYDKAVKIIDACLQKTDILKSKKSRSLLRGTLFSYKAKFLAESDSKTPNQKILGYYLKSMNEFEKVLDECHDPGYSTVGLFYYKLSQFEEAEKYYKKAIQFFKNRKQITCEYEYTYLAELYSETKKYPLAISYLDSSNTLCKKAVLKNYALLASNCNIKAKIYLALNQKDSVIEYKNLELAYTDSLNNEKSKQTKESLEYLITQSEKEKDMLEKKGDEFRLTILVVILIIGIIILLFFKKENQLKTETRSKESDLIRKSTEITELRQKVVSSYSELIEIAKNNDPLFSSLFKELYPEFYEKLMAIQPNLTLAEQRVCFYIKLQFTTKEIAEYTFVSSKAIQNRKNRLRKRLNIEEGIDIYQWIDTL